MDRLGSLLSDYLRKSEGDKPARLGEELPGLPVESEAGARTLLLSQLERERSFNSKLLVVVIVLYLVIFVAGVFLVASNWGSPKVAGLLFGGTALSLMGVVKKLQGLWTQKVEVDLLVTILPGLTPKDRVVAVQSLFYRYHTGRAPRKGS